MAYDIIPIENWVLFNPFSVIIEQQIRVCHGFRKQVNRPLKKNLKLVGGFNPFEKYARQIGNHFPKIGVNIKKQKHLKPPPS